MKALVAVSVSELQGLVAIKLAENVCVSPSAGFSRDKVDLVTPLETLVVVAEAFSGEGIVLTYKIVCPIVYLERRGKRLPAFFGGFLT